MDIALRLKLRLEKEEAFRSWMKDYWSALYKDIVEQTNKYPGWYGIIEQEYIDHRS